ncbi:hypothetical protein PDQ37_25425 [Bacillus cereus]|nr:hypothetical protein [Bacillus cereus]MDA2454411.1 hypothetical protein [Bacillus cereus]MDA2536813.1 hypothetical protein [Bacillus cereus]
MIKEELKFGVNGTSVNAWVEAEISHPTLMRIFDMMRERGWFIQTDQETLEDYPCIAKHYFEGKKGDLLFKSKKYPAGFGIEFYQEINTINRSGGYYDFNKLELMPYLIRCSFNVEVNHIRKVFEKDGYEEKSEPIFKNSKEKVMHKIKKSCHYSEDKTDRQPDYNATDKDKKRLRDGQVKYFRDHKGRLMRGTVYHNINNMWWVVINDFSYTNKGCFELFDIDTEENKQRKLIKQSGLHNPKARSIPAEEEIREWMLEARKASKEERVKKVNALLSYLYSIDWLSRKFRFYVKNTKRLGLQELESNAFGFYKDFDEPQELKLYTKDLPMSNTEGWWITELREFITKGNPLASHWFCNDRNGNSKSYKWPDVREKLWKMGALITQ